MWREGTISFPGLQHSRRKLQSSQSYCTAVLPSGLHIPSGRRHSSPSYCIFFSGDYNLLRHTALQFLQVDSIFFSGDCSLPRQTALQFLQANCFILPEDCSSSRQTPQGGNVQQADLTRQKQFIPFSTLQREYNRRFLHAKSSLWLSLYSKKGTVSGAQPQKIFYGSFYTPWKGHSWDPLQGVNHKCKFSINTCSLSSREGGWVLLPKTNIFLRIISSLGSFHLPHKRRFPTSFSPIFKLINK